MITEQLLIFIKKHIAKGESEETIRAILRTHKWSDADLNQAFLNIKLSSESSSVPAGERNFSAERFARTSVRSNSSAANAAPATRVPEIIHWTLPGEELAGNVENLAPAAASDAAAQTLEVIQKSENSAPVEVSKYPPLESRPFTRAERSEFSAPPAGAIQTAASPKTVDSLASVPAQNIVSAEKPFMPPLAKLPSTQSVNTAPDQSLDQILQSAKEQMSGQSAAPAPVPTQPARPISEIIPSLSPALSSTRRPTYTKKKFVSAIRTEPYVPPAKKFIAPAFESAAPAVEQNVAEEKPKETIPPLAAEAPTQEVVKVAETPIVEESEKIAPVETPVESTTSEPLVKEPTQMSAMPETPKEKVTVEHIVVSPEQAPTRRPTDAESILKAQSEYATKKEKSVVEHIVDDHSPRITEEKKHPWRAFIIIAVLAVLGAVGAYAFLVFFAPPGIAEKAMHRALSRVGDTHISLDAEAELSPLRIGQKKASSGEDALPVVPVKIGLEAYIGWQDKSNPISSVKINLESADDTYTGEAVYSDGKLLAHGSLVAEATGNEDKDAWIDIDAKALSDLARLTSGGSSYSPLWGETSAETRSALVGLVENVSFVHLVTKETSETLNNEPVVKYAWTLDTTALSALVDQATNVTVPKLSVTESESLKQKIGLLSISDAHIWLGRQDHLPKKAIFTVALPTAPVGSSGKAKYTIVFKDFGVRQEVQVPKASSTLSETIAPILAAKETEKVKSSLREVFAKAHYGARTIFVARKTYTGMCETAPFSDYVGSINQLSPELRPECIATDKVFALSATLPSGEELCIDSKNYPNIVTGTATLNGCK